MPATPLHALPYPALTDTADVPRDIRALADRLDPIMGLAVPVVTALPVAPVDGQEIYLNVSSKQVLWHLRYDVSIGDAYKWVYLGGGPLTAVNGTEALTPGSSAWLFPTTRTRVAVPVAGIYRTELYAQILTTSAAAVYAGIASPGPTPASNDAMGGNTVANGRIPAAVTAQLTIAAGAYIEAVYHPGSATGAGAFSFGPRHLIVRPVRVG